MDASNLLFRWPTAAGLAAVLLASGCSALSRSAGSRDAHDRNKFENEKFEVDQALERDRNDPWRQEQEPPERQGRGPANPSNPPDRPKGRGQVPSGPLAPAAPPAPVTRSPVSPAGGAVPDPAAGAVPQIKVVALVGATNLVTDQEVIEAVRQRLPELGGLTGAARKAKEDELYAAELRRVIERELILDEMYGRLKKNGKTAAIDGIKEYAGQAADQTLRVIRKAYGTASEAEFLDILRAQGLTLEVVRRQLERQAMADEYVRSVLRDKGRAPGLGDLRAYYDAHPDEFKTADRVKWLHVFVSANRHPTARAAYDRAEGLRKQAAGGADFAALSKEHDDGVAGRAGGVGTGAERGKVQPPDLEPVVWGLKAGEVSGVVETPAGYHVVKVAEREYAGVRPFDAKVQGEIREKLVRQAREAEYRRVVEDLWRKGPVRVIESP